MPRLRTYTDGELGRTLDRIAGAIYAPLSDLRMTVWVTPEPVPFDKRRSGVRKDVKVGDRWAEHFDCGWFHFAGRVPRSAKGKDIVLLIDVNGELCVVDGKGTPVRGLTNRASEFSHSLGQPVKRVYELTGKAAGGEKVDLWADAGANDLFGNPKGDLAIREACVASRSLVMRALHYDFEVLLDLMRSLSAETARRERVRHALKMTSARLSSFTEEEARAARRILAPELARKGGDPSLSISGVGHAHLDLAWLWPIRETIRKGARTFATAIDLIGKYPGYVFGASQPQLFAWMKERYPALYRKIKTQVGRGAIEPQGVMWVEADTNLSGGEALVRQILYGKRFFEEEFGVTVDYLWEPDVFGYTAALPQILAKSGVKYFLTQKLSWSRINKHPHHSFWWQGIDGSRVLVHMFPEDTYNGPAAPRSLRDIEKNYLDKDVSSHALMVYGIGDGGGGPGAEHLERLERMKNMAGMPPVKLEPVSAFLPKWARESEEFATWIGELYLEYHQGTFTTHGRTKRCNRLMENLLRECEAWAALAQRMTGHDYPAEALDRVWKEVLLYQFHDILPGSSIKRVYDESWERYAILADEVREMTTAAQKALAAGLDTAGLQRPVAVLNSLGWERTEWVRDGKSWLRAAVPALGHTVVESQPARSRQVKVACVEAVERRLENDRLRVTFGPDGSIVSLWDKEHGREALRPGEFGNVLAVRPDRGNAWDFRFDYREQTPATPVLVSAKASVDGPRATVLHTYRIGYSTIEQEVSLMQGSRRLDFETRLRWRETNTILQTTFPVNCAAPRGMCEIQFGAFERPVHDNTTWDVAKDEVPAQKWVDISDRDYGVALLNNGKYGHRIKDGVLQLTLLRSVRFPGHPVGPETVRPGEPHPRYTDQCDQDFTYSLFPHVGDHVAGGVTRAAYELNSPLTVMLCAGTGGECPSTISYLSIDAPGVVIETVKRAESGKGTVVRMYESSGARTRARLTVGIAAGKATLVDLMEQPIRTLRLARGGLDLSFGPYEIMTVVLG